MFVNVSAVSILAQTNLTIQSYFILFQGLTKYLQHTTNKWFS